MTASGLPAGGRHATVPPWRDVVVLRRAAQVVMVAVVALFVWMLFGNFVTNTRGTALSFNFGFLQQTAGFEIAETPIPYTATDTYARAFMVGLLNTLIVSVSGIVLATILGTVVGIARLSDNWLLSRLAAGYVELMRNTPLLVQLVLLYAVFLNLPAVANSITLPGPIYLNQRGLIMPRPETTATFAPWVGLIALAAVVAVVLQLIARRRAEAGQHTYGLGAIGLMGLVAMPVVGWLALGAPPIQMDVPVEETFNFRGGLTLSPALMALLFGLVIYTAAFIGEVVRGGIQAVRRGQLEAAQSIGLSRGQILRLVILPQALRIIVPPLTSQYLNLAKNSSLAIAIGFPDLFAVASTMSNQTAQPLAVIVLLMGTYLAISLGTSLVMNIYNRRVQVLER